MSETPHETPPKPRQVLPARKLVRIFMASTFCYLLLVHIWSLWLPPMGTDRALSGDSSGLAWGYRHFFEVELHILGTWVVAYHLTNLALLYGCMVALFFFTWHTLRGPVWFGSLAATLMMAHPMKTEAVLRLDGAVHLLPAFFALSCFALYAAHLRWGARRHYALALSTFVLLSPLPEMQLGVFGVLALMEATTTSKAVCNRWRPVPFAVASVFAQLLAGGQSWTWAWQDGAVALFLCVYPFALLPETAGQLAESPVYLAVSLLAGTALVLGVGLLIRQRAYWLAVAMTLLYLALGGNTRLDWESFAGGGTKTVLIALVAVAFCAVVQRMFEAEHWRRPLVFSTAALCIFFFGLQLREIAHWQFAAEAAKQTAEQLKQVNRSDAPVLVVPVFEHYHTAPMTFGVRLSDGAFGEANADAALVYKTFRRGETLHLHRDENGFRLYRVSRVEHPPEQELPLQRIATRQDMPKIEGKLLVAPSAQVVVPFGVGDGNDRWIIRTPKTWLQRLRDWESGAAKIIQ